MAVVTNDACMRMNNTSAGHWRTVCTKQDRASELRIDTDVIEVFTCIRSDPRGGRVVRRRLRLLNDVVSDDGTDADEMPAHGRATIEHRRPWRKRDHRGHGSTRVRVDRIRSADVDL